MLKYILRQACSYRKFICRKCSLIYANPFDAENCYDYDSGKLQAQVKEMEKKYFKNKV